MQTLVKNACEVQGKAAKCGVCHLSLRYSVPYCRPRVEIPSTWHYKVLILA